MNGYLRAVAASLVLLALALCPWSAAEAGSPAPDSSAPDRSATHYESDKIYTGHKISLEFQNADLREIIGHLSEVSGKTIIVPDDLNRTITIRLRDVRWDLALDIILSYGSLGVEESGGVLTVYEIPTILTGRRRYHTTKSQFNPGPTLPQQARKVFTPKYMPPDELSVELAKTKSERGKIVTIGRDIYVEDNPEAVAAMAEIFGRTESDRQLAGDFQP